MKRIHLTILTTTLLLLACSAGGGTGEDTPKEPDANVDDVPAATGGRSSAPSTAMGGAEGDPHPLFSSGNASSVDLSDPCNSSFIWEDEVAIELDTGSVVLFAGKLWKLTGESNENWALPVCAPPGTGWCAEQYAWEEVGTCD